MYLYTVYLGVYIIFFLCVCFLFLTFTVFDVGVYDRFLGCTLVWLVCYMFSFSLWWLYIIFFYHFNLHVMVFSSSFYWSMAFAGYVLVIEFLFFHVLCNSIDWMCVVYRLSLYNSCRFFFVGFFMSVAS